MSDPFMITVGDISNFKDVFNGKFLKGSASPRIAMVGRSNVGKSSLINALLGTRSARVSNQPGKTRAIHFYSWNKIGKIVADLPGYGYARTSVDERERWAKFINAYFKKDEALERAVVLLDARHGPTDLDIEAIRFLSFQGVPVTLVFSKSDTLKNQSERSRRRKEAAEAIRELGVDPEAVFWVSSKSREGLNALIAELSRRDECQNI